MIGPIKFRYRQRWLDFGGVIGSYSPFLVHQYKRKNKKQKAKSKSKRKSKSNNDKYNKYNNTYQNGTSREIIEEHSTGQI
jgi:uncharacterized membrane protein YkgB